MASMINTSKHIDTNNIQHNIVQYIDDSTNIIACKDNNKLQIYINIYFKILEEFYNTNKLLINSDKTKLLIITKPGLRHITSTIKLQANKYLIEQSKKIKVLGIFISSKLDNIVTINSVISK